MLKSSEDKKVITFNVQDFYFCPKFKVKIKKGHRFQSVSSFCPKKKRKSKKEENIKAKNRERNKRENKKAKKTFTFNRSNILDEFL